MMWPFVGREELVAALHAEVAEHVDTAGVMVCGPAGVGKSSVVRAVADSLGAERPVGSFTGSAAARTQMLGAFHGLGASGSTRSGMDRVEECIDRLTERLGDRRAVVMVDDGHMLDPLSVLVVHAVVRRRLATLVLTLRSDADPPAGLMELVQDHQLRRLDVGPLHRDAVSSLTEVALAMRDPGGVITGESVDLVWRLSGGIPLYVRHLLDTRGAIPVRLQAGRWLPDPAWAPSTTLADLVHRRFTGLDAAVVDVIDVVALAEPVAASVVSELCTDAALEDAEAHGFVTALSDGFSHRIRLGHPLYGEVRRGRLTGARAGRLKRRLATALRASTEPHDVVLTARLHLGGGGSLDPDLLVEGAREALSRLDPVTSAELSDAAVAAGGGVAARLTRSYVQSWNGGDQIVQSDARWLLERRLSPAELWQAAELRTGTLLFAAARPAEALDVIRRAASDLSDTTFAADAHALHSWVLAFLGKYAEADLASRSGRGAASPSAKVYLALSSVVTTVARGGDVQALSAGDRLTGGEPSFHAGMLQLALAELEIWGLRLTGRAGEAARLAARLERDPPSAHGVGAGMVSALVGYGAHAAGRLSDASWWFNRALGELGDERAWRANVRLQLTQVQLSMGAVAAEGSWERAETDWHPAFVFRRAELDVARAARAAAAGRQGEAVTRLITAADRARDRGERGYEVHLLATAVRYGHARVSRRLSALVGTPRSAAAAIHAHALHVRSWQGLHKVSEAWEDLGDLVSAADAEAQAARVARADGDLSQEKSSARRLRALLGLVGGLSTPAVWRITLPEDLTPRELQVAILAAQGASNRDIAVQLTLSVRTVENHMYRAMIKLGAHNRLELRGALRHLSPA